MDQTTAFERNVEAFASDISHLIDRTVQARPTWLIETTLITSESESRARIELVSSEDDRSVPITAGGSRCAALTVRFGCRPDSSGRYMAVTESAFVVYSTLERTPLFRLEYREDMHSAPSSHWQVHAERGALSNLLTLGGHERPHSLSALHLPVGGARMRPGLEDFLQFVIEELGADADNDWQDVLEASRETWRRRQVATGVRDVPDEAVRTLRELGYVVEPPADGDAPTRKRTLRKW